MLPGRHNLTIYRGDGFSAEILLVTSDGTPLDIATSVFTAQCRSSVKSSTLVSITCTPLTPSTAGKVRISLTGTQTRALQSGVWDLQMVRGAEQPRTLLAGAIIVRSDVI